MKRIATLFSSTPNSDAARLPASPRAARSAFSAAIRRSAARVTSAATLRASLLGALAVTVSWVGLPAQADYTGRVTIDWVRVDGETNVARVKPKQGISNKASCQTVNFMVVDLADSNAKTFLATIYTASATKGAKVRLFGTGSCIGGAEVIDGVSIFPGG